MPDKELVMEYISTLAQNRQRANSIYIGLLFMLLTVKST